MAGLAHSYGFAVLAGLTPPDEGTPKAEEAARRAIALDSTTASAYLVLAGVEMGGGGIFLAAGKLIDKAIALDPGDAEAHVVRALWFRWREELDSSLADSIAHRLDPLNAAFSERVARHCISCGATTRPRRCINGTCATIRGGAPNDGLIDVYRAEGRTREALDMMRAGAELRGDSPRRGDSGGDE